MGKKGIVIGGGGGSAFDEMGAPDIPIYIDADGEAQKVTSISDSLLTGTTAWKSKLLVDSNGNPYNVGADDTPVKFKNGVPVAITGTLKNDISGNAKTATTASNASWNSSNDFCVAGKKDNSNAFQYNTSVKVDTNNRLRGAAWNDFAEFRLCTEDAGICVVENKCGRLIKSTRRLEKGAYIVSDTYGMSVGDCTEQTRPVAVAGRVLAYSISKLKVGDVVCSGKNGTVSKMNRLEILLFPDRILGVVSELPTYGTWNGININNRIWVRIK